MCVVETENRYLEAGMFMEFGSFFIFVAWNTLLLIIEVVGEKGGLLFVLPADKKSL